ncbi:MAG: hypothetical protein GDA36_12905 [Rhodobacteraceae bacterium]|nr:hypothetical protein [Paracoccaceae bacterium]
MATQVDFTDPYHFSRCFKVSFGVTPSDATRPSTLIQSGIINACP